MPVDRNIRLSDTYSGKSFGRKTEGQGKRTMKTYVLDACAILALIKQEHGYEVIEQLYLQAEKQEISLAIHKINLLEIHYNIFREASEIKANQIYRQVEKSPIIIMDSLKKTERSGHLVFCPNMQATSAKASYGRRQDIH